LVERVRLLDGTAWRSFAEIYYPLVYGWCRRAGLQEHDAADVVQEVFRAVAGEISAFRKDRPQDSLRNWLRGIARHKLQDFWRSRQRRDLAQGGTAALEVLATVISEPEREECCDGNHGDELKLLVQRALIWVRAEVHEQTWQAAMCVLLQGESVAEVANRLQLTPNAVYKSKTRVLRRLRELLGEWEMIGAGCGRVAENS
jgi:RNA polymerase sigma-70 factor (ECF subfamily)